MAGLGLIFLRRGGQAHPTAGSDYILSATKGDPEVFRILMANGVSSDGVGITKDDAAKVTTVSNWFTGNANIESFDEFKFFTGVTRLGATLASSASRDAFAGCSSLRSVELPPYLMYIGSFAFFRCNALENVGMPETIVEIGAGAFRSAGAPKVINFPTLASLPKFIDIDLSYTFRSSKVQRVENLGNVKETFGMWSAYTLTDRYGVFYECENLEYADISNLEIVGFCMFGRCAALKEVIMRKAKIIRSGAFISCSGLEKLRFPQTLTQLQEFSVAYCNKLTTLIFESVAPPSLDVYSLDNLPSLESIYVPDASVNAYKVASNWSSFANKIKPLSEYQGE